MARRSWWRWALEWTGHAEAIHALVTADFVTRLVWPTVATVLGATSGWFGGIPLMWIIVGSTLIFMAVTQSLLRMDEYRERKNPAHKLAVVRTLFNFELVPISPPNRKHRRSAAAQGGAPAVPAVRHFVKGQLGFEVWNRSSFPISLIVMAAKTKIEDNEPPRADYPNKAIIIQPSTTMWVHDKPIDLEDMICDNLDGSMDILIRYGLPGDERFEIHQKGTVEIFMEQYGHFKGLYFHPDPETDSPTPLNISATIKK